MPTGLASLGAALAEEIGTIDTPIAEAMVAESIAKRLYLTIAWAPRGFRPKRHGALVVRSSYVHTSGGSPLDGEAADPATQHSTVWQSSTRRMIRHLIALPPLLAFVIAGGWSGCSRMT